MKGGAELGKCLASSFTHKSLIPGFIIAILIYNFIYPIRLRVLPGSEIYIYIVTIGASFLYFRHLNWFPSNVPFFIIFPAIGVLLILSILSILYNNSIDYLSVLVLIKYLFAVVISYVLSLLIIHKYKERSIYILIKFITLSTLLIAVTCILEFFVFEAKLLFNILINTSGNIEYGESFRVHGLATGGGASLSVGLSVGAVLALFLSSVSQGLNKYFWIIVVFIIYIGCFLVGRTGFYLLTLFLALFILKSISFKSIFLIIPAILIIYIGDNLIDSDHVDIFISHAFEPINNYLKYGEFTSKTTTAVAGMYYLPNIDHFVIGAGYWRYPTHDYVLSDPGYMKTLFAYGIFGFILFYGLQLYLYKKAYQFYKRMSGFRMEFMYVFVVPFIVESKEAFFVQNYTFKIIILLIIFSFLYSRLTIDCRKI
jgi:hypothetical protein